MTKYRNPALALACAAVFLTAGRASAGDLDEAFAPKSVPGLELASLDVPVMKAKPAPAPEPTREPAEEVPAAEPEKSIWQKTMDFFGL